MLSFRSDITVRSRKCMSVIVAPPTESSSHLGPGQHAKDFTEHILPAVNSKARSSCGESITSLGPRCRLPTPIFRHSTGSVGVAFGGLILSSCARWRREIAGPPYSDCRSSLANASLEGLGKVHDLRFEGFCAPAHGCTWPRAEAHGHPPLRPVSGEHLPRLRRAGSAALDP
jgi:hypothetical protein